MSRGFASNNRIGLLASLVLLAFGGLGVRLVWLHVIDRKELLGHIEKVRHELIDEPAVRGNIVDLHDNILATSRSMIVLGADPSALRPAEQAKWPRLAEITGIPLPTLATLLTTKSRAPAARAGLVLPLAAAAAAPAAGPAVDGDDDTGLAPPDATGQRAIQWVKLKDEITESEYQQINQLGIYGIYGKRIYRRAYPHHELAAHLVGYVNKAQDPVCGIESYLNFYLRGENGWVESEKDAHGQELAQYRTREVPQADGYNVKLSIDAAVQTMVEEELAAIAKKYQPLKATIIVSDPRTGFILALGNYPTFDLTAYNKLKPDQLSWMRNVAVDSQYEPGSVFKIVAASAALDQGLVTPETRFDCTLEKIEYKGKLRGLPKEDVSDHFTHPLSVAEIIAHSSNKGAAQLAMLVGDERFYDYARNFGFGQRTGFPVGSEIAGTLVPLAKWDGLTITRLPMGQGAVSATPIQMQQAMGVIASGGLLLRPQLITQINDRDGRVIYAYGPAVVRRVISEKTARIMSTLLQGVASETGGAPEAEIPGYDVAGKTGTANKVMPKTLPSGRVVGAYSLQHHVTSFVGFFPAHAPANGRQVEIAVIVDDPDAHAAPGTVYGRKIAAPSFKNLALKLIPYLDIRPARAVLAEQSLALEGGRR
jgi:cell division protein FtsI (penicillin-binding protein 3)